MRNTDAIFTHFQIIDKFDFNRFIAGKIIDTIEAQNRDKGSEVQKVEIKQFDKFTFALIHSSIPKGESPESAINFHRYHKIILHQSEDFYTDSNVIDYDKFVKMEEVIKTFFYLRAEINTTARKIKL